MKKENFKNYIFITEPNIYGDFNTEAYEYVLESDHKITSQELKEILFEACEIERIYKGEIYVEIQIQKDNEYYDSDECVFEVDIKLTKELTPWICWDKCPNLSPIYKIDKEISTIQIVEN